MVRPYSLDLRERVVAATEAGQSCRTVANRFGVSVASVVKWRQRARSTGSPAAKRMGGSRPVLLAGRRAWILQRMSVKPHISIRGLMAELAEEGTIVSYGAVWTFLHRQGLSHKKKPARQRTGPTRRRPASRPLEKVSAPD
jgi:transposase